MKTPPKKPCFAAGTLVTCKTDLKPIEQITVGEIVLSRNMKTGQNEWKTVTETFTNHAEKFVVVELENECVKATGQHTFWNESKQKWTKAHQLEKGEVLLNTEQEKAPIKNIEILIKNAPTYNLEVEANHNYYVGKNQVLTHNASRIFKYADRTEYEFIHYLLKEQGKELYVGITVQEFSKRFSQQVVEGKRALAGIKPNNAWKAASRLVPDYINLPIHLKDIPNKLIKMTFFEARIIEMYELQIRGGKDALKNLSNPMSRASFVKWQKSGHFNPCRFYL